MSVVFTLSGIKWRAAQESNLLPPAVPRERILMRQLPICEGCSSPVRPPAPGMANKKSRTTRLAARGTRTPLCRRAGAYLTLREGAISPSPTPTPSGRGMCAVPRGRSVPAVMRNCLPHCHRVYPCGGTPPYNRPGTLACWLFHPSTRCQHTRFHSGANHPRRAWFRNSVRSGTFFRSVRRCWVLRKLAKNGAFQCLSGIAVTHNYTPW